MIEKQNIVRSPEIRKIISDKRKETLDRHSKMFPKTIKLKISQYNPDDIFYKFEKLFLEAKWWRNDLLSRDIFNDNLKRDYAIVKYVDDEKIIHYDLRNLEFLGTKSRGAISEKIKENINSLHTMKLHGEKVGSIKYKKESFCVPFKQYKNSFEIIDFKHIYLSKIGKIKVDGLEQILVNKNDDFNLTLKFLVNGGNISYNSYLIKDKNDDYYFVITIFKEHKIISDKLIGIDFGIGEDTLTIYDGNSKNIGLKISFVIQKSNSEKDTQNILSKKQKGGKNYLKTKEKLNKIIIKRTRTIDYIHNTIVSILTDYYGTIYIQDKGNIHNWQRLFGKQVEQISLGKLISKFEQKANVVQIDKWLPTTKKCPFCNHIQDVSLDIKIITCEKCNHIIDRNIRGAINIYHEGLLSNRDVKFQINACGDETSTLQRLNKIVSQLNLINDVSASVVYESGKVYNKI